MKKNPFFQNFRQFVAAIFKRFGIRINALKTGNLAVKASVVG